MRKLRIHEVCNLTAGTKLIFKLQKPHMHPFLSGPVGEKVGSAYCEITTVVSEGNYPKYRVICKSKVTNSENTFSFFYSADAISLYDVFVPEGIDLVFMNLLKEKEMTKEEQEKFVQAFETDIDKIEGAINKAFAYLIDRYMPEIKKGTASPEILSVLYKSIALSYIGAIIRTAKQNTLDPESAIKTVTDTMTIEAKERKQ